MQRKLRWQAEHDSLTNLMNRRIFEERLARSLGGKRTGDFPMSLLYLDLDHFKSINDRAGHAAGDELLRQIAHLMQSRIRDTDSLARMGGNEFAVVLRACPRDKAEGIARDIKARIDGHAFQWEGTSFQVGASVGVVHVPSHWTSLDECLAAAATTCYKAKHDGHAGVAVHHNDQGAS
jgi:diguanylate cyclase (GGDEF)-like protein